jgi:predicted nucleic acid-binding protein
MLLVVADTGPIHYLVEIGHIGILPQLFERIFIPSLVCDELRHPSAPAPVRAWVNTSPPWLEVLPVTASDDPALQRLDDGEKSALTLGMALGADLILIDDRKGAAVALQKGFQITGTLGLVTRSAQRGLLDLADALERLKRTSFYYRQELFDDILKKYGERGNG